MWVFTVAAGTWPPPDGQLPGWAHAAAFTVPSDAIHTLEIRSGLAVSAGSVVVVCAPVVRLATVTLSEPEHGSPPSAAPP